LFYTNLCTYCITPHLFSFLVSVEEVADAVIGLIEDDTKNGLILRCSKNAAVIGLIEDDTKNGLILRCSKNAGCVYSTLNVEDV